MNSQIYQGYLMHSRLEPVKHTFVYPVYYYALDLLELPQLNDSLNLFGYNHIRPIAIHDQDYLGDGKQSILTKLFSHLQKHGYQQEITNVKLVTTARYFNYVFNPVSFFYCYCADGSLGCTVVEINNTYGETHLYILDQPAAKVPGFLARYQVAKEFYVSPFNDLQGDYDFYLSELQENLDIRINIVRAGKEVFVSRLWGTATALTDANLIKTLMKYPISAALAMPRITKEALILRYRKGLKPVLKPQPTSPMTIRQSQPSWHQQFHRNMTSIKHKIYRQLTQFNK
jgi:cyclopropane-fatty-acyl-phospholipid synthase